MAQSSPGGAGALASVLDVSQRFDAARVRALETLTEQLYAGAPAERAVAHDILQQFEANPNSWRVVGSILEQTKHSGTVYLALSILENCVATRWPVLPAEQRAGIKQYVSDLTVRLAAAATPENKFTVNKANGVLVQIVKHEWPERWPTFIADLCAAARTSPSQCMNTLNILTLLSEEVFDFNERMTARKTRELKDTLTGEFQTIYELCAFVLKSAADNLAAVPVDLVRASLECLIKFIKHIPEVYVCDEVLLQTLLDKFWGVSAYRVAVVRCLLEVASLTTLSDEGIARLRRALWAPLVQRIAELPQSSLNYSDGPAAARNHWESFYSNLALCLSALYKNHRNAICEADLLDSWNDSKPNASIVVLEFLTDLTSKIGHDEGFKIVVDFWNNFSHALFEEVAAAAAAGKSGEAPLLLDDAAAASGGDGGGAAAPAAAGLVESTAFGRSGSSGAAGAAGEPIESPENYSAKLRRYQPTLCKTRRALISRMARPQEVLIKYDEESGTVEREYEVDTDEVTLYNSMRETLVFLTNLGGAQTEAVMLDMLQRVSAEAAHAGSGKWNPQALNRLCWAIGSVSGAMSAARERSFLVKVVKDLLVLCEQKRGKENKAVVAAMIMYTFGQYPRFLRHYVRFLEVVMLKLFEFMQDPFPGVQDMACDTLLKVFMKCADAVAGAPTAAGATAPGTPPTLAFLAIEKLGLVYPLISSPKQQMLLAESAGYVIAQERANRALLLQRLLAPFNDELARLLVKISLSSPTALEPAFTRKLAEILRVHERVAFSARAAYAPEIFAQYEKYLHLFRYYAAALLAPGFGDTAQAHTLRSVRAVKKLILTLFTTVFANVAERPQERAAALERPIPAVLEAALTDFRACPEKFRDCEVLALLSALFRSYGEEMTPLAPTIFGLIFDCSLDMIKGDFHSYPDHRAKFYEFLNDFFEHDFAAFFAVPDVQKQLCVEALVWAFQHEEPGVADRGLRLASLVLRKVSAADTDAVLRPFCRAFFWPVLRALVDVLTDTLHKAGLDLQCIILMQMLLVVESGRLQPDAAEARLTKGDVLATLTSTLLARFPNLASVQVEAFGVSLFNQAAVGDADAFRSHVRDFLVNVKEFGADEEFFRRERDAALRESQRLAEQRRQAVPGFLPQYDFARPGAEEL